MESTIKTMMKTAPVTIQETASLAEALDLMVCSDVQHLPVLAGDTLLGVLSERDILRRYSDIGTFAASKEQVRAAMNRPPVTAVPGDTLKAAIELVASHAIGCLPVVEGGRLVGIVTRRDLLAQVARQNL